MSKHCFLRRGFGFWIGFVVMARGCTVLAEEPFDYFHNNWNVIGLKDYQRGTRVAPDNRLELEDKAMVAIRVGKSLSPLSRRHGKTLREGWLPIILMSADRQWLASVYPKMRRAVDWTIKARRQAPADSPFVGVLPNALADGEFLWNGKYHIVGYDLWNLRGMLCAADAARILGKKNEGEELLKEAKLYRDAIDAAWRRTELAYFPPSWEKVGTHWGNTETLWPTELFDREDPRVLALIDHVREDFHGGFIEGTIQWPIGT